MITLITGTPGSGKSVYAVWHEIKPAIERGRNVYSCGIPKLSLPAIPMSDAEARNWHLTADKKNPNDPDEVTILSTVEEGSLIVIDEVQRLWRPTGAGQVSPDIAALETHRHHGIDFVVITQHPSLLHRNVRALVGRHIHLRATALGNYLYEFPEWCENPQTKSARTSCVRSRYRLPKAAFGLYESASLHVKTSKRKPIQFFVLLAVLMAVPVGAYALVSSIAARTHAPSDTAASADPLFVHKNVSAQNASGQGVSNFVDVRMVSNQFEWSKISACVSSETVCRCYGDGGEVLAVPVSSCRDAVRYGWSGRFSEKEAKRPPTTKEEKEAKPTSL